jgi:multimeric flavodoxin WrbA
MKVLGIYGSPRREGNTDILLDECLKGVRAAGAQVLTIRCCDLTIAGCVECGGCDETGECIIQDDMQTVYPKLLEADVIVLASPMFFYGITSQAKALIDRCQAMWCRSKLRQAAGLPPNRPRGRGYLICVGATKGSTLFQGAELVAKYFYDALDMTYEGGVFVRKVEGKGDILKHGDALKQAFDLGLAMALNSA